MNWLLNFHEGGSRYWLLFCLLWILLYRNPFTLKIWPSFGPGTCFISFSFLFSPYPVSSSACGICFRWLLSFLYSPAVFLTFQYFECVVVAYFDSPYNLPVCISLELNLDNWHQPSWQFSPDVLLSVSFICQYNPTYFQFSRNPLMSLAH